MISEVVLVGSSLAAADLERCMFSAVLQTAVRAVIAAIVRPRLLLLPHVIVLAVQREKLLMPEK